MWRSTKEVLDRPHTTYTLTDHGRQVFHDYLALLEKIIKTGQG